MARLTPADPFPSAVRLTLRTVLVGAIIASLAGCGTDPGSNPYPNSSLCWFKAHPRSDHRELMWCDVKHSSRRDGWTSWASCQNARRGWYARHFATGFNPFGKSGVCNVAHHAE